MRSRREFPLCVKAADSRTAADPPRRPLSDRAQPPSSLPPVLWDGLADELLHMTGLRPFEGIVKFTRWFVECNYP